MNRYSVFFMLLSGLFLLVACAPPAVIVPTVTPAPVITMTPAATLSPKALQDAIFVAVREDNIEAMKQYIAAGANINDGGALGVTPVLKIASIRGNAEMVKLLLNSGAKFDVTAFHLAITNARDNVDIVQVFIEHGADVNQPADGLPAHTPLMFAAEFGHVEIGRLLLEKGADIDKLDAFGDPALNVAAFHGQMTFAKMLVEKGAALNIRGQFENTAVGHALSAGHTDVADYLKGLGATE